MPAGLCPLARGECAALDCIQSEQNTMAVELRIVAVALSALFGCAAGPEAVAPRDGETMLAECQESEPAPDVRAWECRDLTAVETLVLAAEPRDLELAFDGFAARFGGPHPRRIDSVYTRGDTRHVAMRLEGDGTLGAIVDAQMVAIAIGGGFKVVTCSSKAAAKPCGPVIELLVHGVSGPRAPSVAKR